MANAIDVLRKNKMRALHAKAAEAAFEASPNLPDLPAAHIAMAIIDLLWPLLNRGMTTPEVDELRRIGNLRNTKQVRIKNGTKEELDAYDPSTDPEF